MNSKSCWENIQEQILIPKGFSMLFCQKHLQNSLKMFFTSEEFDITFQSLSSILLIADDVCRRQTKCY